jgi:type I restriction enzyme, S subunit
MAVKRQTVTFQQLIDDGLLEIGDGYRAQNHELGGTGPIFLRAGHVTDTHIDFTGVEHFHIDLTDKLRPKMSQVGDTIITTKGNSTGRTSFVTARLPPFVYSPHLSYWRTRDPKKLCGGFLRYWSQGIEFVNQLSGMKASTDMAPYLSLTDQRRLTITLPPVAEQRAIAAILGALDDKIELNRRMNATLEAMARALFQSWFVDFDPVRAKLDGRQPAGMDAATAALFPKQFDKSSEGRIPSGWQRFEMREVAELSSGGTPSKSNPAYWNGDIPWVSPKAMSSIHVGDVEARVTEAAVGNGTRRVPRGAVLVMVRGMGLHQGVRISQAQRDVTFNQDVRAVVPKAGLEMLVFWGLLHVAGDLLSKVHASGHGTGVLATEFLEKVTFVVPPSKVAAPLMTPLADINSLIASNDSASRTLAALRDTLLPKLLSGELRIKDAERFIGSHV